MHYVHALVDVSTIEKRVTETRRRGSTGNLVVRRTKVTMRKSPRDVVSARRENGNIGILFAVRYREILRRGTRREPAVAIAVIFSGKIFDAPVTRSGRTTEAANYVRQIDFSLSLFFSFFLFFMSKRREKPIRFSLSLRTATRKLMRTRDVSRTVGGVEITRTKREKLCRWRQSFLVHFYEKMA